MLDLAFCSRLIADSCMCVLFDKSLILKPSSLFLQNCFFSSLVTEYSYFLSLPNSLLVVLLDFNQMSFSLLFYKSYVYHYQVLKDLPDSFVSPELIRSDYKNFLLFLLNDYFVSLNNAYNESPMYYEYDISSLVNPISAAACNHALYCIEDNAYYERWFRNIVIIPNIGFD